MVSESTGMGREHGFCVVAVVRGRYASDLASEQLARADGGLCHGADGSGHDLRDCKSECGNGYARHRVG